MWKAFEFHVIKNYKQNYPNDTVWHWSEIPDEELVLSGWISDIQSLKSLKVQTENRQEFGIDGLAKKCDGSYTAIQAKYWDASTSICSSDLGTFLLVVAVMREKNPQSKGVIYFTSRLEQRMKERLARLSYISTIYMPYEFENKDEAKDNNIVSQPEKDQQFQCTKCSRTFDLERGLTKHQAICNPSSKNFIQCSGCGKNFASNRSLDNHLAKCPSTLSIQQINKVLEKRKIADKKLKVKQKNKIINSNINNSFNTETNNSTIQVLKIDAEAIKQIILNRAM